MGPLLGGLALVVAPPHPLHGLGVARASLCSAKQAHLAKLLEGNICPVPKGDTDPYPVISLRWKPDVSVCTDLWSGPSRGWLKSHYVSAVGSAQWTVGDTSPLPASLVSRQNEAGTALAQPLRGTKTHTMDSQTLCGHHHHLGTHILGCHRDAAPPWRRLAL